MFLLRQSHALKRSLLNYSLILVSLFCLTQCAQPVATPQSEYVDPIVFWDNWQQSQQQRQEKLQTLRIAGRMKISRGIFAKQASLALLLARPQKMRLEAYSILGMMTHQLIAQKGWLQIYYPDDDIIKVSERTRELLKKELGLDIAIEQLWPLLLAELPQDSWNRGALIKMKDSYLLQQGDDQATLKLPGGIITSLIRSGKKGFEVEYTDFKTQNGALLPGKITLKLKQPAATLELWYEDIILNDSHEDILYRIDGVSE